MDHYPDEATVRLLLRALGTCQDMRDGAPVADIAALARRAEVPFNQLARLIATGIHAGWIVEEEDGRLGLTETGRRRSACWE